MRISIMLDGVCLQRGGSTKPIGTLDQMLVGEQHHIFIIYLHVHMRNYQRNSIFGGVLLVEM